MISGALSLALAPGPLVVAAIVIYGLPLPARRVARIVAAVACAATLALLGLTAAQVWGGGRIDVSYGSPVTGIDLLVRADPLGMLLAIAAAAMVALLLANRARSTLETGAFVVCVLGAVLAAMAGNAVVLFAGLEIATVGTALGLAAGRRRPGRGALMALTVMHAASLGVLAAGAQLHATAGTSEFTAVPQSAAGAAVALPWALGAALLVLMPAVLPLRSPAGPCTSLAGIGALPCGVVALLRLREVTGGVLPPPVGLTMTALGAASVVAAAAAALRWAGVPAVAGRALLVASGGGVIVMAGLASGPAAGAMGAGMCALLLGGALASLWESGGGSRPARYAGAAALAVAGGAPGGFAVVASALEVGAAASRGRSTAALTLVLAAAAVLTLAGGLRAAVGRARFAGEPGAARLPVVGVAALAASILAALFPGAVSNWLISALVSGGGLRSAGWAAVSAPAGGWAVGYFAPVTVIALVAVAAAATLQGWRLPSGLGTPVTHPQPRPSWALALRLGRLTRRPRHAGARAVATIDGWLMVQPQLPLIIVGGAIALFLIR